MIKKCSENIYLTTINNVKNISENVNSFWNNECLTLHGSRLF